MFEPRRQPPHGPRRARGLDATNLCLLFAAALATLPWLFAPDAPDTTGAQPVPRNATKAVAARVITATTNPGAAT